MPWHLIARNLLAHPVRTLLTASSLVIAVFLICTLRSLVVGLTAGVEGAASNRLVVQSAVSLFVDLPLAYQGKVAQVPGVRQTCKFQWFGGYYQDPSNFFAQFGVDADRFYESYPEVEVLEGDPAAFLATRAGCLIGRDLTRRYGWKVGDRVPIKPTIFQRADGGAWEFEVVGIYRSRTSNVDDATLFFQHDYLREALEQGAASGPPGVGVYMVTLAPGADLVAVSREIDVLFENGPQRVQTTTEAEFQRQFVSMLGGVPTLLGSIGGGVLFAILLAVLNTMLMAGRERTRDLGIIKALGFGDGVAFALLMLESLLLCGVGGAIGVGLSLLSAPAFRQGLSQMVPGYAVTDETAALGLGLSLLLGVIAGAAPAWRAGRLRVIQALRPEA
ncbi:MAG: ABC transporter permease [Planctomycetes bacterium]|nr:ABC transporter permease [Planctomycetota bacterium]